MAANIDINLPSSLTVTDTENSFIKLASTSMSNFMENYSLPIKDSHYISPIIEARSSITIDMSSGQILFEKNAHLRKPIASITKLMTIIIALEENSLDETVEISGTAATVEGSTMFLRTGEKITLKNLLYGALIHSANDAAFAIAEHNAGNTKDFVKKMNDKALELGLVNTHFSNPAGLDERSNYSSAYDVAKMAKYVYQNDFIREAAQIKDLEVLSIDGNYTHKLESTNELLGSFLHIKGLKTGKTDAAGLCLVSVAENDSQNEIITVVLDSPARFKETKILIDWIFRAYKW